MRRPLWLLKILGVSIALVMASAACSSDSTTSDVSSETTETESTDTEPEPESDGEATTDDTEPEAESTTDDTAAEPTAVAEDGDTIEVSADEVQFLGEYVISDDTYGTETVVTLTSDSRIIQTNSLPPWDAGEFPEGNNTELAAVDATYTIPLAPVFTGEQSRSIVFGVSIAGIKFDAGTAQQAQCENDVNYNIEAVQSLIPFGLDRYGAHVQNDGTYHYHKPPAAELEGEEPEFVGWALDGYSIYYSPNDEYPSSYQLRTEDREGIGCTYSEPDLAEISFDVTPDGTFTQDWEYVASSGALDECNGIEIGGEYVYFVTDEYPIVPRCLNGAAETVGGGGRGGGGAPPADGGGGAPPADGGGDAPAEDDG